jgi:EpsI family protein
LSSFDAAASTRPGAQISRRSLVVGAGFVMVAAAALAVSPRRHEMTLGHSRLADVIPTQLGSWSLAREGGLILPNADPSSSDVYDQVLARTYFSASLPPMMLLIAYGAAQSGLMQVHRPEICYASSGFAIKNDHAIDLPLAGTEPVAAKAFLASREDRTEQVLYWTRISDAFPRDLASQRLVMLERGVRGVIPDGVLVRCSTLGADAANGEASLLAFVRTLVANAGLAGRDLLLGAVRSRGLVGTGATL